jgi:uncharacterized Zn-binding protein involved in type VI secretion
MQKKPPAAKAGDRIMATDVHILLTQAGTAIPFPHPFTGIIDGALCANVNIMGRPAATVGSTATNTPAHVPAAAGMGFQKPPANLGTIVLGSPTVRIGGQFAARHDDVATTCNDPADAPVGKVVAVGTVRIG